MPALPPTLRLRVLELRVGPERVLIEGQVRTHADAEALVAGLRQAGLDVSAPRTEHLSAGGVSFAIAGKVAPPTLAAREKETR